MTPQQQNRTFGPFWALLLANLFARAVTDKYVASLIQNLNSWLVYNKPEAGHYQTYYPQWYPIENPYQQTPELYITSTHPSLTTIIPATVIPSSGFDYDVQYPQDFNIQKKIDSSLENPNTIIEPIAAASSIKYKRQGAGYYRRKQPGRGSNRNKYRRRTTTKAPVYYDSYEDYDEDIRTRPNKDSYEEYYYDSTESTTRYKPKRRPTKNKNKKRRREPITSSSDEVEFNLDDRNPNPITEIVIVRQAQISTTTEPTTLITNGTTTTEPSTSTTTTESTTTISTNSSFNGKYLRPIVFKTSVIFH